MKLLSRLLKGTPVTPPKRTETPEWHPLDELDNDPAKDPGILVTNRVLTDAEAAELKARWVAAHSKGPIAAEFVDDYPAKPWLDPATCEPLAAEARAELATPAQCTAPTKTGRPCSKPPRPGSDRCTLPAHQRT